MNKVLLVGRIIQKPIIRETPGSNIPYTKFKIAIRRDTSQNSKEESDFVPVVAWRNTATYITNYLNTGDLVSLEGSFNATSYKNNNNEFVNVYEVLISNIKALEARKIREERSFSLQENQNNNSFSENKKSYPINSEPTFVNENESVFKDAEEDEDEVDWELEM